MPTVVADVWGTLDIPAWVTDLHTFRRWVHSGVLPKKLAAHFFNGGV
jgi:hypothetical protein